MSGLKLDQSWIPILCLISYHGFHHTHNRTSTPTLTSSFLCTPLCCFQECHHWSHWNTLTTSSSLRSIFVALPVNRGNIFCILIEWSWTVTRTVLQSLYGSKGILLHHWFRHNIPPFLQQFILIICSSSAAATKEVSHCRIFSKIQESRQLDQL